MSRSLCLLSAATAVVFAQEDRIPSAQAGETSQEGTEDDKQFWIGNRFRRPFPLRTMHKPYIPQTMRTPQMARDAADKLLFGWNQGNEAALLRLMATGAFVEDYTMLSLPVMTDFGASSYSDHYLDFYEGISDSISGACFSSLASCSSVFFFLFWTLRLSPPKASKT